MHYIRFLKPPQISKGVLSGKLTITNDLGDAFLSRDLTVQYGVIEDSTGNFPPGPPTLLQWRAGSRELQFSITLPAARNLPKSVSSHTEKEWRVKFVPYSTTEYVGAEWLEEVLDFDDPTKREPKSAMARRTKGRANGCVLAAFSAPFSLYVAEQSLPAVVYRKFELWGEAGSSTLMIEEEAGNSIARHIWDAGVMLSALIRNLCITQLEPEYLASLWKLLRRDSAPAAVLELGTGCAIVSATLSHMRPADTILATDMEEALEIATANLAQDYNRLGDSTVEPEYLVLDWTEELPSRIAEKTFNLILVADCTYNSDVVPALVDTLKRLTNKSPKALIAVGLKRRHDSESIFFDLMNEAGLKTVEVHTERSGMFDGDQTGREEEIEVHVFAADS